MASSKVGLAGYKLGVFVYRGWRVPDDLTTHITCNLLELAERPKPLGSEQAARTLNSFGIRYHFVSKVPYILNRQNSDVCPFEKLSVGKTPDEFYETIKALH